MTNVKWYAVNYKTEEEAKSLSKQIQRTRFPDNLKISFEILDNSHVFSSSLNKFNGIQKDQLELLYTYVGNNLGYFGAAKWRYDMVSTKTKETWDWVIISNVDVKPTGSGLWEQLCYYVDHKKIGAMAPNVISSRTGRGQNPHMLNKPHKIKLEIQRFIAKYFIVCLVYTITRRLQKGIIKIKKNDRSISNKILDIYSPHGSIIAFHKNFTLKSNPFEHCAFLYSEELSVAERIRNKNLKVIYVPKAKLIHKENVSTGWWPNKKTVNYIYDGIDCTVKKYFRYS